MLTNHYQYQEEVDMLSRKSKKDPLSYTNVPVIQGRQLDADAATTPHDDLLDSPLLEEVRGEI